MMETIQSKPTHINEREKMIAQAKSVVDRVNATAAPADRISISDILFAALKEKHGHHAFRTPKANCKKCNGRGYVGIAVDSPARIVPCKCAVARPEEIYE